MAVSHTGIHGGNLPQLPSIENQLIHRRLIQRLACHSILVTAKGCGLR